MSLSLHHRDQTMQGASCWKGGPANQREEKGRGGEGRGGRREYEEAVLLSLFLKQEVESVDRLAGSWPVYV